MAASNTERVVVVRKNYRTPQAAEREAAWRRENPERVAARFRAWKAANRKHVYHQRKIQSRKIREELIEQLGGCCVECGAVERLEFDHIHGTTWDLRKVSGYDRIRRYKREADAGLLQLLCKRCNQKKGRPEPADAQDSDVEEAQPDLFERCGVQVPDAEMGDAPF